MPSSPVRPGHPPADIAHRLRNQSWGVRIKAVLKLSDDCLDDTYLPPNKSGRRRRYFQRVRTLGSDPRFKRDTLSGESAFDRVHQAGGDPDLDRARDDFNSVLWEMLTTPSFRLEDYRRVIHDLLETRHWYRVQPDDVTIFVSFLPGDPAYVIRADRDHIYSTMLAHLESHPCANNVALLAALFREAMLEVALDKALLLRESLLFCATEWIVSLKLPRLLAAALRGVIEARLIHNHWITPLVTLADSGTPRKYVDALLKAYVGVDPSGAMPRDALSQFPIVRMSPTISWMKTHHTELKKAGAQLYGPDAIGMPTKEDKALFSSLMSDSTSADLRKKIAARFAQLEEDRQSLARQIEASIHPPKSDTRYCLPLEPGHQGLREGRPLPYLADGILDTGAGRKKLRSEPVSSLPDDSDVSKT